MPHGGKLRPCDPRSDDEFAPNCWKNFTAVYPRTRGVISFVNGIRFQRPICATTMSGLKGIHGLDKPPKITLFCTRVARS